MNHVFGSYFVPSAVTVRRKQTGGREPDCSVCWQRHREKEVRKGKCFSLCSQCLVILISFSVTISQRMVQFQAEDVTWINIFFLFLSWDSITNSLYILFKCFTGKFNQPIKCFVVSCISSLLMHVFCFFQVSPLLKHFKTIILKAWKVSCSNFFKYYKTEEAEIKNIFSKKALPLFSLSSFVVSRAIIGIL